MAVTFNAYSDEVLESFFAPCISADRFQPEAVFLYQFHARFDGIRKKVVLQFLCPNPFEPLHFTRLGGHLATDFPAEEYHLLTGNRGEGIFNAGAFTGVDYGGEAGFFVQFPQGGLDLCFAPFHVSFG